MDVLPWQKPDRAPSREEFRAMAADSLSTVMGRDELRKFLALGRRTVFAAFKANYVGHNFGLDDFEAMWQRLHYLARQPLGRA